MPAKILQITVSIVLLTLCHCGSRTVLEHNDPGLQIRNDVYHHDGTPFTGIIRSIVPAVEMVRLVPYRDGLVHGTVKAYHSSGTLIEKGRYEDGKPTGVHRSWYNDGQNRSYAVYEDGLLEGERWVWHKNGRVFQFQTYEAGKMRAHKQWRENGLIYMNYVYYTDGAIAGLPGSKVCEPVSKVTEAETEKDL